MSEIARLDSKSLPERRKLVGLKVCESTCLLSNGVGGHGVVVAFIRDKARRTTSVHWVKSNDGIYLVCHTCSIKGNLSPLECPDRTNLVFGSFSCIFHEFKYLLRVFLMVLWVEEATFWKVYPDDFTTF